MKKIILSSLFLIIASLACSLPGVISAPTAQSLPSAAALPDETETALPGETASPIPAPSETVTPSQTPTLTYTPSASATVTFTPTVTETIGPSVTPTFAAPVVTVNQQAHCRYCPNKAYLHAAVLYAGDVGTVQGRINPALSRWLFIKFDKLNYYCWVAPSVVDVTGNVETIRIMEFTDRFLPGPSVLYDHPHGVSAVREGKNVTISWDVLKMTDDDDRGYFLDLFVCQDGAYLWWPVALDNRDKTSYTIKDEAGCPLPSSGRLYGVEKHAYTIPIEINWPQPEQ